MVDALHRATVCVVPMRTGFGIKNKTLEAMAAGVPVVGSDRGLEGLPIEDDPPKALRANQVMEYCDAIARLFEDVALRQQLARAGRSLVEQTYTWERVGREYERVLEGGKAAMSEDRGN
jgi:glycosyltransferase involved in cell wall biosynthesis